MKALRLNRCASWISLGAAFTLTAAAVMQATAAPAPQAALGHAAALQPVLGAQTPAAAPAVARSAAGSIASTTSRYYQNRFPVPVPAYDPTMARLHEMFQPNVAGPHTSTGDPVVLQAYSGSEVVHITNGQTGNPNFGTQVRAPQTAAQQTNLIGPNIPLTFTVKVNNGSATTTASAVYIQIKNPNSAYQGSDGLEHKVFTHSPADPGTHTDDGSAAAQLYNGGFGEPYYVSNNVQYLERGAAGGTEGTDQFLGIGRLQGNNFTSWGQEYECQYLSPFDNNVSTPANPSGYTASTTLNAAASDYGTPYYLAGFDDQAAGSFGVSGAGAHGVPTDANGKDWLKLTQSTTDPTLYSATWAPPSEASDFYLDVIVVDSAHNWRIYDNVWGFSTQYFDPTTDNDILFVSDNTLGQKFAASALAGGITNLRPIFYGAESYLTDVSTGILPNAVYDYHTVTGQTTVQAETVAITSALEATPDGNPVLNGLGYGSYADTVNDDTGGVNHLLQVVYPPSDTAQALPIPKSQAYSIWRILCRGPLSSTLLTTSPAQGGYATQFVSQPAVNDAVSNVVAPASTNVAVATRCVVWSSPFTGDQPLTVSGSLNDPSTQTMLRAYVANGGRLFVTGQEVANTLTEGGQFQNAPGGFVYDVLNALWTSSGAGADNQTLVGVSGLGHPIGNEAYFNFQAPPTFDDRYSNYFGINFTNNPYTPPGAVTPLAIGNDYTNNASAAVRAKWRTDGAMTQLGPSVHQIGNSSVQGQISIVTPENGATADFTDGGGAGLLFRSNYTSTAGAGYGSKTVFASFGLEGLSNEYYSVAIPMSNPAANAYFTHNNRPNILHNIVNWMRTGSYQGRVFLGSSNNVGVAGATVFLTPFGGAAIPGPRQVYSAITADGLGDDGYPVGTPVGFYHMDGLEPGAYIAVAYKSGFTEGRSPTFNGTALPFTASGDTTVNNVNLNINPLPPGSITGHVYNGAANNAPVTGATVTFTSTTGGGTVTATTDSNGFYSVTAPQDTYTGVATSTNPSGSSPPSAPFSVTTGQSATENFTITLNPGTITGTVTNGVNGPGIGGATVGFTLTSAPAGSPPTTTTTTNSSGAFTSPGLSVGTYTVTVSAAGFFDPTAPPTITVVAGAATNIGTIVLEPASAAALTVNVTAATGGLPVTNATVTVTTLSGATVATLTNSGGGAYTGNVPEGTYTITASDAPQYETASQQVSISSTTATVNIALVTAPTLASFPGGKFNLVSWPYTASFVSAFGPLLNANATNNRSVAFNWNALSNTYRSEGSGVFPVDEAHPGYGYFIYFYGTQNVYGNGSGGVAGTAPSTSTVNVPLNQGWNMVGPPSTTAISVSQMGVVVSGVNSYPFDTSAAGPYNYVFPVLYGYNPTGGTGGAGAYYPVVSATGPYGQTNSAKQLQPFTGYWIYAYQGGLTLTIPTGG